MERERRESRPRVGPGRQWGRIALRAVGPLFWSSLLVLHLGLLFVGEGAAERGLGARVALLISSAFFALKLLRPGFLRPRCPRRGIVLFVLLAALVHQDVRIAAWEQTGEWQILSIGGVAVALVAAIAVRARGRRGGSPSAVRPSPPSSRVAIVPLPVRRSGPRGTPLLPRPPPAVPLAAR